MSISSKLASAAAPPAPHVIVEALAGTGKTTTLIEGLKLIKGQPTSIEPSPQQAAVWEAMQEGRTPRTICFAAFNKSIAQELERRVPAGCEAKTMHSIGNKAVRQNYKLNGRGVNNFRTDNLIEEVLRENVRDLRRNKPILVKALKELVGKVKANLADTDEETLMKLAGHYEINLDRYREDVITYVPQIIERSKDVDRCGEIDFNDMIWIPVVNDLNCDRYDLLLCDELQDFNACQHALAMKTGRRILGCGDANQSIYGFAGADTKSMDNFADILSETKGGVVRLPLTVTRRCGQKIVDEAKRIVPTFEAHETCGDGQVKTIDVEQYTATVREGDMVLCRTNAPLVKACFAQLKKKVKANIQGRDIGEQLIKYIKELYKVELKGVHHTRVLGVLSDHSSIQMISRLEDFTHEAVEREKAKRHPSEYVIETLKDRCECLSMFAQESPTVDQVINRINDIFTDTSRDCVLFSSGHKAKGLECKRVFLLDVLPFPHPMAKQDWEIEGEYNLRYVMVTRAIEELYYVKGSKDDLI